MGKLIRHIVLLLGCSLVFALQAFPQDIKTVSGVVTSAEDGSPISDGLTVYTYMTVASAKDDYTRIKQMLEENSLAGYVFTGIPNSTTGNYYSVHVPASGALLFFYEDARVLRLEEVKGRLEINVALKVSRQLQKAVVDYAYDHHYGNYYSDGDEEHGIEGTEDARGILYGDAGPSVLKFRDIYHIIGIKIIKFIIIIAGLIQFLNYLRSESPFFLGIVLPYLVPVGMCHYNALVV